MHLFDSMRNNKKQRPAFQTNRIIIVFAIVLIVFFFFSISGERYQSLTTFSSRFDDNRNLKSRFKWDDEGPDSNGFCKEILENPKPFSRACGRRGKVSKRCSRDPKDVVMFSQFRQDYYLYVNHFSKLKRRGSYLDIATNEPMSISNTFFFDRCLGWSGICVEANPQYFEPIYTQRSCHLVPTCLTTEDGTKVSFVFRGGLGGIRDDTYKNKARFVNERLEGVKMRCTNVSKVLNRYDVSVIDYLSLDIEGHELAVLKGVDWNKTIINVMTVEANGRNSKISKFLKSKGYYMHVADPELESSKKISGDVVFLHKDVKFGKPV